MGAVLTPALIGVAEAGHLPNASTFCGRCESVCPVKIPLPKLMRHWRERQFSQNQVAPSYRAGLRLWAWVAQRPALYHALAEPAARLLGWLGERRGRFRALPLAGGWTQVRDLPAPEGRSFHALWAERQRAKK
jgi:L-lactate dehydrogenase complex protein LldF